MLKSKKIAIALGSLLFTLLISCSKKTEDFVGIYTFYHGMDYYVTDSTTNISKGILKKYKEIKTFRHIPIKIDIFKTGENIAGTITITNIQQEVMGYHFDNLLTMKKDLVNFHLVGDTLMFEFKFGNSLIGEQTKEFKLLKAGEEMLLIADKSEKDLEREHCNKSIKSMVGNHIFYTNSSDNQADLVKESNLCADEMAIKNVSSEYPSEKLVYLKELLSKH